MPSPDGDPSMVIAADSGRHQADATVLTRFAEVAEAYRPKELRQALYDDGGLVMADTLLDSHGEAHRSRRRLENRLFRRETFLWFEEEMIRPTIESVLAPAVRAGRADLIELGYRAVMHLTAQIAGIDRPDGTDEESDALLGHVVVFGQGATMVHASGDRDEVRRKVTESLEEFDRRFFGPSMARRRAALQVSASGLGPAEPPRDVLALLVAHGAALGLDVEVIRREVAFYLQAGGHSTANALTHTLDDLFQWTSRDPTRRPNLLADPLRLQRAVHESLRLHPASPEARRRALDDCRLASGRVIHKDELVVLDLSAANRDPEVWGPDAAIFDPERALPPGVAPWGLSFGAGMHACIGAELDGGLQPDPDREGAHLLGTVTLLADAFLRHGVQPDPDRTPHLSSTTKRPHFESYPVIFS